MWLTAESMLTTPAFSKDAGDVVALGPPGGIVEDQFHILLTCSVLGIGPTFGIGPPPSSERRGGISLMLGGRPHGVNGLMSWRVIVRTLIVECEHGRSCMRTPSYLRKTFSYLKLFALFALFRFQIRFDDEPGKQSVALL